MRTFSLLALLWIGASVQAVSPLAVQQGQQLFERKWTPGNPAYGSDGLGPLFNGQSCVTCHHQGGVGGSGDSRFNAKTVGIETMKVTSRAGFVSNDVIAKMVSSFHPGFVQLGGAVANTMTLPHHGGSSGFQQAQFGVLSMVPASFSEEGGPTSPTETRQSFAVPIVFNNRIGPHSISLRARIFHRNTSPLFGLGLIDQVSPKLMEAQVKAQKSHREISGRPSTLDDTRYGKFGWRANVATLLEFNDQACANEVGLETKRKRQASDPLNPGYRNPTFDISDDQIKTMTRFVAALPAPICKIPSDSHRRQLAERGERVFQSVGCAICHVPDMPPAMGVYSDLLLHDMGYESMDLNYAEPYRVSANPIVLTDTSVSTSTQMTNYYGRSASITQSSSPSASNGAGDQRGSRSRAMQREYTFVAPTTPPKSSLVDVASKSSTFTESDSDSREVRRGNRRGTETRNTQRTVTQTQQLMFRVNYEPTNYNQEWRTPPLWGVADSAPYMHDGRAETLLEAIAVHEGEGAGTRDRFLQLPLVDRHAVVAFLETLVAPPNAPQVD